MLIPFQARTVRLALLSCLALSAPLHAEPGDGERYVTFSGFGTLGVVHNQGDGSTFIRDTTQPNGASSRGLFWETDSRLGIQASLKATENLAMTAQVISHYRTENNFQPEVTWAFLKYTPNDIIDLRAGRVGFDIFLSADSRDVGYSYLWVRPPVEYYGTLTVPYIDGGDITMRLPVAEGTSRLKLYSGIARQKLPFHLNQTQWAGGNTLFGGVAMSGTTLNLSGSRITGGFVDYQDNHWIARIGKADFRLAEELKGPIDPKTIIRGQAAMTANSALANALYTFVDDFSPQGKHISFASIGVSYENGPLQAQAAINHFTSKSLVFPESHAAYISLGYRYGKFVPYGVISAVRSTPSLRAEDLSTKGAPLPIVSLARFMLTADMVTQHTYTLGMRYDMKENLAIKVQMDIAHNRNCSPVSLPIVGSSPPCSAPILWSNVPVTWDGRANIYSAVLDFTF